MPPTRREFALTPLVAAACGRPKSGWKDDWNRLLVGKAVRAADQRFNPEQSLVMVLLGPEYHYHTRLRNGRVHATRDSADYALNLLEEGSEAHQIRARKVLSRVVAMQVADPASDWYGLWGYYLEEPPDRMAPADWNWADFIGATLLVIEYRHGAKLGAELRARVRQAIHHAAYSIARRNVSMNYTNIAVKGAFVTLAAAELLNDSALQTYSSDRLARLCQAIDATGSFAEYNSPTYARVALTDLTRIRMFVKGEPARRRAAAIERRLWLHLAAHWDVRRMQFAGPMSRSYGDDLGYPLWLEKALSARLHLATVDNRSGPDGETAIHDYRCPEDLAPRFLQPAEAREQRELFLSAPPTSGVTYIAPAFSLGSVERGEFWVQRRPLIGYFGDDSRPPRTVRLRVVKDGYDFSSALFYSVQQSGRVLGIINFRSPGGDRHISLDPIRDDEFNCGRLFVELAFGGLAEGFTHTVLEDAFEVKAANLRARFRFVDARFGARRPALKLSAGSGSLVATLDLKPLDAPRRVRWAEIGEAYAAIALELAGPQAELSDHLLTHRLEAGRIRLNWGALDLAAATRVSTVEQHDAAYEARIDGHAPPLARLSDEKLA